jgi:hypothetical protein
MAALHAYDSVTLERGATSMRGLDKRSFLGLYELLQAQAKAQAKAQAEAQGLVFDDEVDDFVPTEAHDALIDVIVTPSQILRLN